jgi:hypothetical protein
MVNRGGFVVNCVAEVVVQQPLIRVLKIRQLFDIYFSAK